MIMTGSTPAVYHSVSVAGGYGDTGRAYGIGPSAEHRPGQVRQLVVRQVEFLLALQDGRREARRTLILGLHDKVHHKPASQ